MITWKMVEFGQLTSVQAYELLKLRVDVFVVEQECPYPELDNKDLLDGVVHLIGFDGNEMVACARLLPPGVSFAHASIGRFVTKPSVRGCGVGRELLAKAIDECGRLWPDSPIDIQAQAYLRDFYESFGFKGYTDLYVEDGIPHIDMRLA